MEVVGGVASILQLTKYVISTLTFLCETYEKAKSWPERLQRQLDQVRSLRATIEEIQSSTVLNNPNVVEQLRSLKLDIQLLKTALEKILARNKGLLVKRVLRVLITNKEYTRLESILVSIERGKSSLSLSILSVQSTLEERRYCEFPGDPNEHIMPTPKSTKPKVTKDTKKVTTKPIQKNGKQPVAEDVNEDPERDSESEDHQSLEGADTARPSSSVAQGPGQSSAESSYDFVHVKLGNNATNVWGYPAANTSYNTKLLEAGDGSAFFFGNAPRECLAVFERKGEPAKH